MPIQLKEENGGKIIVVRVSGKLVNEDYEKLLPEFERLSCASEKLRILYEMSDFHGWDLGALYEGAVLKIQHFDLIKNIERCAMVGDKKWQEVMTALCKPFTKSEIRYFDLNDIASARKWLEET